MAHHPRIGVGVFIRDQDRILMLKRKNAHGEGTWALIGGHLEFGESIEDCARREVKEEIGIDIHDVRLGPYTNDHFPEEGKHYVTIFAIADHTGQEIINCEPEKCEKLEWFSWDALPENLFVPVQNLKATGFDPFKK